MIRFLLTVILCSSVFAQHKIIKISDHANPNEPSICVNPIDTSIIMAGSNLDFIYLSQDGGDTWETLEPESEWGVAGDPCIIADTNGQFYFFHLSNNKSSGYGGWLDRIVCQKFNFEEKTFNNGSYMGQRGSKDQDKEWAVVDPRNNNIYATWTEFDKYRGGDSCYSRILFSRSTDEGKSWSTARKINILEGDCEDSDQTTEGAVPAVGPNGEVYVTWSFDEKLFFSRSTDEGETWSDEKVITSQPGGWVYSIPGLYRCNGLPITKCDLSGGPHHGRIYVNWTDQRNGFGDTDVWLIYSDDSGETWSDDIKVNDDKSGNHQFLTWMDVDQKTGNLWFVWYDRRNYMDNQTDVFAGLSVNGGKTITNFKINKQRFLPQKSRFFGDYTNISAYNNKVMATWCAMEFGNTSIWAADIRKDEITANHFEKTFTSLKANPLDDQFFLNFSLKTYKRINLKILNSIGKTVKTVYNNRPFSFGEHTISLIDQFEDLNSGIYFVNLNTGQEIINVKVSYMQ